MNVGGQAVIEGVMMRAPNAMAVAVRRASTQQIVVLDQPWRPLWTYAPPHVARVLRTLAPLPVIRGALVLVESLFNGFQALSFAAEEAEHGGRHHSTFVDTIGYRLLSLTGLIGAGAGPHSAPPSQRSSTPLIISLVMALTLFVGLPHALAMFVSWLIGGGWDIDSLAFHLLDGGFKLAIFIAYVASIGQIPEVRRVFEYHGAEHKVVNAFERGRALALDEVRLQDTFHARCGTSFVLLVLTLSIAFFSIVLPLLPPISGNPLLNHLALVLIKVPLMMPLAGLAYEFNRWLARQPGSITIELMLAPGRWMQQLTTREPNDQQLEIALAALKVALERQNLIGHRGEATVRVFDNLAALEMTLSSEDSHVDARQTT